MLISVGDDSVDTKSDWVCLEFSNTRKLYVRLPYDPFTNDFPAVGVLTIDYDMFELVRTVSGDNTPKLGLMALKEQGPEFLEPPYLVRLEHVSMIAKLSPESQIHQRLQERVTGITPVRSGLVVPKQ